MLNEVPTARDPWALMQHLPGVSIGRPNVGGSESTNQAQFAARGDNGANTMWNIDGVTITDMAAAGASTTYFDFNVVRGSAVHDRRHGSAPADRRPRHQHGVASAAPTRCARSAGSTSPTTICRARTSRARRTPPACRAIGFSSSPSTAATSADRCGHDRLWFWGGVSQKRRSSARDQRVIRTDGVINTAAARGDAQLGTATRASRSLYHRAEKLKWRPVCRRGPAAGNDAESGWARRTSTRPRSSHVFGPALFLSGKFAYVDLGFGLTPQGGLDGAGVARLRGAGLARQLQTFSRSDRAQYPDPGRRQLVARRHDVKFGFQHRRTSSHETGGWPGDRDASPSSTSRPSGCRRASGLPTSRAGRPSSTETGTLECLCRRRAGVRSVDVRPRAAIRSPARAQPAVAQRRPTASHRRSCRRSTIPAAPVSRLERCVAATGRRPSVSTDTHARARQLRALSPASSGSQRRDLRERRAARHDPVPLRGRQRRSPGAGVGAARSDRHRLGRESRRSRRRRSRRTASIRT